MAQAQQLDDEVKGGKVLKAAAKRAAVQKEAGAKKEAGGKIAAAAKRAVVKKPEPPKPAKKFGFEDLPGEVKDLITGVVKKNKNRKDMIKDAKEKLKGYKLPGYTKMTNEELYDWVYGGKLDKAVAELDEKNAEKQAEKKKFLYSNHVLTLFNRAYGKYRDSEELNRYEKIVRRFSKNPTAGFYGGEFENSIRTDIGDGERFVRWYTKDLTSSGGKIPIVIAYKDSSNVTFLTLDTDYGKVNENAIIKKWRIYAKPGSSLHEELGRMKKLPEAYDDVDDFLRINNFKVDGNNVKYVEN